jgi:hypothetical protein
LQILATAKIPNCSKGGGDHFELKVLGFVKSMAWITRPWAAAWCTGAAAAAAISIKRTNTAQSEAAAGGTENGGSIHKIARALVHLRAGEEEMRLRWTRDELGWRKLPPRAWPPYQPGAEDIPRLATAVRAGRCGINVDGLLAVVEPPGTQGQRIVSQLKLHRNDDGIKALEKVDCVQGACEALEKVNCVQHVNARARTHTRA